MGLWDWSQHHVVSGYRTLGTSTERRQTLQDFHVGLATTVTERLSFVEMSQLLGLSDGATRSKWRVMMSGPMTYRLAEQNLHTPDAGLPRLILVPSATEEAQQRRGLDQTSWLGLQQDSVVSGLECGIRAV